jgi:hypothetical protein
LFGRVVVQGGIAPEYFLDHMDLWEAAAVLEASTENYRTTWEQTRYLAYVTLKAAGSKLGSPQELLAFTWEKPIVKKPFSRLSPERKAEMIKTLQK